MGKELKVSTKGMPDLLLQRGSQAIMLSTEDIVLILQRLLQEGQLHLYATNQDWLYSGLDVMVEVDVEGLIYLTPCDGVSQPNYTVALPEPYADAQGNICNPWGV